MSKILVVDDEKSIRITFEAFLAKEGLEAVSAENVDAALQIMEETELDLIITDIIMPRITGMKLLEIIKDKDPDIPIIIMTGEPTIKTAIQSVKENAYDYIVKPVHKEMLIKIVKKALEFKKLTDNKKQLEIENLKYRENLEKMVEERTNALQDTMHAMISTIGSISELRDSYTVVHEKRVGNLAVAIGRKMHLPNKVLECLYVAGYMHDIGKIAVPIEILTKTGLLSELEFNLIKAHVAAGFNLLKRVTFPWPIAEVVHQHHERIDGSGYPLGIKGSDMRIESKIIAVADVIEAMTSHRPYRPSLGLDAALHEIETGSGVLYDKEVAEAACDLFREDGYTFSDATEDIRFEL